MSEVPLYKDIAASPYSTRRCRPTGQLATYGAGRYRGTSLIRNCPPPWNHRRTLGIILLEGPRSVLFLMGEVPLYSRGTSGIAASHTKSPPSKNKQRTGVPHLQENAPP